MIGAVLDRNGLRPSRYWVTDDDRVIMASEVGVLDVPPEKIVRKGRLEPGRPSSSTPTQGRIIPDDEIKAELASLLPYQEWLDAGSCTSTTSRRSSRSCRSTARRCSSSACSATRRKTCG